MKIRIRQINKKDKEWVEKFIRKNWGSEKIVAHRQIFYPTNLPGFVAQSRGKILGLVAYHIKRNNLEIITMNAVARGKGIGTSLLQAIEKIACKLKYKKVWLITTNDNIDALAFYLKNGFIITKVHKNALEFSRKIKPEIPLFGNYGIPLKDEIELEKFIR